MEVSFLTRKGYSVFVASSTFPFLSLGWGRWQTLENIGGGRAEETAGWAGTAGAEGEGPHFVLKRIWEGGEKLPAARMWIKEGDLTEIEKMTSLWNLEEKDEDVN